MMLPLITIMMRLFESDVIWVRVIRVRMLMRVRVSMFMRDVADLCLEIIRVCMGNIQHENEAGGSGLGLIYAFADQLC